MFVLFVYVYVCTYLCVSLIRRLHSYFEVLVVVSLIDSDGFSVLSFRAR